MRLSTLIPALTLAAAAALSAGTARAAKHGHGDPDGDYPLAFAERPLTLPRFALSPELDLIVGRVGDVTTSNGARVTLAAINVGASFGITKDLEVGAFVLPFSFAPKVSYGSAYDVDANIELFATYRFFHNRIVEIGGRLRTYVITATGAGAQIVPGVPLLFHFGKIARLDAEVAIPITARGNNLGATVGLSVPVALSINIVEPFFVGAKTGAYIDDFGDKPSKRFAIPLGLFAGYSIGDRRPIVDVGASFYFDRFLRPGAGLGEEKLSAGDFQALFFARGYIYL